MRVLDYFAVSFVLTLLFKLPSRFHAPSSLNVVNAIFRSDANTCYALTPVVVECAS